MPSSTRRAAPPAPRRPGAAGTAAPRAPPRGSAAAPGSARPCPLRRSRRARCRPAPPPGAARWQGRARARRGPGSSPRPPAGIARTGTGGSSSGCPRRCPPPRPRASPRRAPSEGPHVAPRRRELHRVLRGARFHTTCWSPSASPSEDAHVVGDGDVDRDALRQRRRAHQVERRGEHLLHVDRIGSGVAASPMIVEASRTSSMSCDCAFARLDRGEPRSSDSASTPPVRRIRAQPRIDWSAFRARATPSRGTRP